MKREGILFCLCGPAAAGKTTVSKHLIESHQPCSLSISVTSRKPREGEQDGKSYHFVTLGEFEQKIAENKFFEFEKVHDNYYGTLQSTIDNCISSGEDLILDIDIRGAKTFRERMPKNTVVTFITPPSAETMVARMKNRAVISDEELKKRMKTAEDEYQSVLLDYRSSGGLIDYFVVNNEITQTCKEVSTILEAERHALKRCLADELSKYCTIKM